MSVGAAVFEEGMTATELVNNANVALYGARIKGVGSLGLYSENGRNYLQERIKTRQEIERAIRYNEFELYYQP